MFSFGGGGGGKILIQIIPNVLKLLEESGSRCQKWETFLDGEYYLCISILTAVHRYAHAHIAAA